MLVDFDNASDGAEFHADLCVVGAGAAGITLAIELLNSGKKILLIEGGGLRSSNDSQSLYAMAQDAPHYPSVTRSRLRFFGGSTNHWEGSCQTFDPIDFERRSWVSNSGWPFSYEELAPYYDRAFRYLELGRRYTDERPFTAHLGQYQQKIAAAGFRVRMVYSSPPTRFAEKYGDTLHSASNISVLTRANLVSVNEAMDRRSVTSLTICNYKGQTASVKARHYVICLGGIENARALLLSDAVTPGGIGNEHDVVGRYFMDHPVIESAVFYPTPAFAQTWRNGRVRAGTDSYRLTFQADDGLLRRSNLTNARMPLAWAPKAYTSPGVESAHQLAKSLDGVLTHMWNVIGDADIVLEQWRRRNGGGSPKHRADEYGGYVMQTMIEQRPDRENRVLLSQERDALGLRKGKILWRLSEQHRDDLDKLLRLFARGMGAQGIGILRSLLSSDTTNRRFEELMNFGHHHMGTTRASFDPKYGVVDGHQRVHGRENLYLAGSSTFPTDSNVPPTTTIVATTIRLADHLRQRLN